MKPIYIGTIDTRSFDFMVVGDSPGHCVELMREAWAVHCKQFTGADPEYIEPIEDNMNVVAMRIGTAIRDHDYDRPLVDKNEDVYDYRARMEADPISNHDPDCQCARCVYGDDQYLHAFKPSEY